MHHRKVLEPTLPEQLEEHQLHQDPRQWTPTGYLPFHRPGGPGTGYLPQQPVPVGARTSHCRGTEELEFLPSGDGRAGGGHSACRLSPREGGTGAGARRAETRCCCVPERGGRRAGSGQLPVHRLPSTCFPGWAALPWRPKCPGERRGTALLTVDCPCPGRPKEMS